MLRSLQETTGLRVFDAKVFHEMLPLVLPARWRGQDEVSWSSGDGEKMHCPPALQAAWFRAMWGFLSRMPAWNKELDAWPLVATVDGRLVAVGKASRVLIDAEGVAAFAADDKSNGQQKKGKSKAESSSKGPSKIEGTRVLSLSLLLHLAVEKLGLPLVDTGCCASAAMRIVGCPDDALNGDYAVVAPASPADLIAGGRWSKGDEHFLALASDGNLLSLENESICTDVGHACRVGTFTIQPVTSLFPRLGKYVCFKSLIQVPSRWPRKPLAMAKNSCPIFATTA